MAQISIPKDSAIRIKDKFLRLKDMMGANNLRQVEVPFKHNPILAKTLGASRVINGDTATLHSNYIDVWLLKWNNYISYKRNSSEELAETDWEYVFTFCNEAWKVLGKGKN